MSASGFCRLRLSARLSPSCNFASCACLFCVYSLQPSEPHLTSYLKTVKHFGDDTVNNDIYPVWTYAYFGLAVGGTCALVAPVAIRLRDVILIGTLGRVATRFLLIFASSLPAMQLMQVTYAAGSVAELMFAAFVFEVTPRPQDYARKTSWTQVRVICVSVCVCVFL